MVKSEWTDMDFHQLLTTAVTMVTVSMARHRGSVCTTAAGMEIVLSADQREVSDGLNDYLRLL